MNGSELWGNIVSGAIAGIVAAVFLPAALFLLNWIRNRRLERKIREGFGLCGAGRGETFHLFVENHLPIEVRIRAVVLVGGQNGSWHLHLNYLQPGPHTALLNAISRQEHPTRIFAGAHFPDAVNPTVAVSLPGFSGGTWGVPLEEIRKRPWVIESGWMIVEYPTLFGGSAFFRLDLDRQTIKFAREMMAKIRADSPTP